MKIYDEAFFKTIRDFLTVYLPKHKRYSKNTISSYRFALNLYIDYLTAVKGQKLMHLSFGDLNRENVIGFLNWLQDTRKCSTATRNQRLMALHSFIKYAGLSDSIYLALQSEVSRVPIQKAPTKIVEYLQAGALKALLEQPDRKTLLGIRNSFFMILMYDTAARCQELLDLRIKDFILDFKSPYVYLTGKGDKIRSVPLMDKTVEHYHFYMSRFHSENSLSESDYLFYTTTQGQRHQMSPDNVASFMKRYGESAKAECAEIPERVHPHQLRHTRAIDLYRGGVPLALLSEFLGHANLHTTQIYAYADTEMKRAAIRKAIPTSELTRDPPKWREDDDLIRQLYGLR